QFTDFYYKTFDENRQQLAALYRDQSMLTFETTAIMGTAGITDKLSNLPFTQVRHQISTLDAQPSSEQGGILIL
ncbi:Nuclear transport factor 2, partial [Cryomyces antarcticus]